jgi:hypothetical protein
LQIRENPDEAENCGVAAFNQNELITFTLIKE